MKEKRALVLLIGILVILFIAAYVSAAENDAEVEKSYACLKKQLGDDCGNTQNTAQAAFSLLAMAHDSGISSDCKSSLNNKKKDDCWGDSASSASCTVKATAIAVLALKNINSNVDDSIDWLISKKKLATELTWYLEIDANNATECTINNQKVSIGDNKKITGTDPLGLRKAYSNYWFEIIDTKKNYTISCDKDFVTTLIYKRTGSGIFYVSSETHSASAADSTTESVNGYCLSTSDKCDYEGTLWGALALSKAGEDVSPLIPYLVAMSDDPANAKYLPLAFLYMLDNSVDDYLAGLLNLQKQSKYWDVSGNKLYDTALALLALQGTTVDQAANARDYLLTLRETSGENAGCWKSDTSFILYSGWPKAPSIGADGAARGCTQHNYFCVSRGECPVNASLANFDCLSVSEICCEIQPAIQTCEQKGGIICEENQECSQTTIPASDTRKCCIDACQNITAPVNECEDAGYFCRAECGKGEEEKTVFQSSCAFDEKCCTAKPSTTGYLWLIILLIILIILVILAIIFRNQLKIYWFKIKSNFKSKKGPAPTTRPSPPPYPPARPTLMPRQIIPRTGAPVKPPVRPPIPPKKPDKDKEFEETMKKLREMSK